MASRSPPKGCWKLSDRWTPNSGVSLRDCCSPEKSMEKTLTMHRMQTMQGKTRLSRRCAKSVQKCAEPQKMENPTRNLAILRGILVRSRELESLALWLKERLDMSFHVYLCAILYRQFVIFAFSCWDSFCQVALCCRIFVALSFGGLAWCDTAYFTL